MWSFLKPEPHRPLLSKEKIDPTYKRLRWQVFIGIFIGYAGYYLVRKNFSLAMPYLVDMGFDKGLLGVAISANAIAYGLSKFIMGGVSDRSSARGVDIVGFSYSFIRYESGSFFHRLYVYFAISDRLVSGDGMASVWPCYDALVFTKRKRNENVYLELRP